jgi:hypothetical protein
MSRSSVESFFRTLILGDFEENQNFAGQMVGGLVSMIPVLDQVMDVRDIAGALFRINQRGGFRHATTDQIVNLGFAAFGVIPEVGSAFKTVFKPLYKERRAARGAVNGGLQAVERLLGMRKGGAITWVRTKVLGKWVPHTNAAIQKTNAALDTCILFLDTIANLRGWKDYLVPDSIQQLAKEMLPSLRRMKSGIAAALQRASNELREFLEDLLGEQAAAVVMAVGGRAASASANPGARTRNGHNAAAPNARPAASTRQNATKVKDRPRQEASRGSGPTHPVIRATAKVIKSMAAREKGLVGEHMVDYFETKRLGGSWTHDKQKSKWTPATIRKINSDKRPVNLALHDLPRINQPGLDAVWMHGEDYTVTEAKASTSVGAAYGFGKYKESKGWIPKAKLTGDLQLLHYVLSDYDDKGGGSGAGMMQMGFAWTDDRSKRETGVTAKALRAIQTDQVSRRVVFVSFESDGAIDHATALVDIHAGQDEKSVHPHIDHGVTRAWDKAAIDAVDRARESVRKPQTEPVKPIKGTKGKK